MLQISLCSCIVVVKKKTACSLEKAQCYSDLHGSTEACLGHGGLALGSVDSL